MVKIATWNICLGLKSKKEYVKSKIIEEKIDICCIQESEIPKDFPGDILSFKGYSLENKNRNRNDRQRLCWAVIFVTVLCIDVTN